MTTTLRRQRSQVRSERDEVARQAEERSDDEAAQPPSNPVGRTIFLAKVAGARARRDTVVYTSSVIGA